MAAVTSAPQRPVVPAARTLPNPSVEMAVFAWEWARALSGTNWVPLDRTVIAERLRLLADQAADAMLGRVRPSAAGRSIGEGVVAVGFAAPDALGRTLYLLAGRLLDDLGIEPADPQTQRRLAALVASVGVGFARAAHDRTLAQQDAIRNSDLIARQRAERALRHRLDPVEADVTSADAGLDMGPGPDTRAAGAGPEAGPGGAAAERAEAADMGVDTDTGASAAPNGSGPRIGRTGRVLDTGFRAELPDALERGEVVPYYQPIVALDDERLLGFEALARWEHPLRGTLPPAAFLPSATDTELFRTLGRRLRADACRTAVSWQRKAGRPVFVGVNVSPPELRDPRLVEDVRELLDRTGLESELLHLEITEDVTLSESDLPVLRALAATGVRLTLDDFGTGLSRLAMLPALPVHGLKLAGALLDPVRQLPFPAAQAGTDVLGTVTALADRLGLTTTVEGIENKAEAGLARRIGIARAQGWLYGRPLPGADVAPYLA